MSAQHVAIARRARARFIGDLSEFGLPVPVEGSFTLLARRLEPDAVVCATGCVHGVEPLIGHLGVLDYRGIPRVSGATPAAPGMWFNGFTARPSLIGYMAKQSKGVAKRIAKELVGR